MQNTIWSTDLVINMSKKIWIKLLLATDKPKESSFLFGKKGSVSYRVALCIKKDMACLAF